MSDAYYEREGVPAHGQPERYLGGPRIFRTSKDAKNEAEVAHEVEQAWPGIKFHSYGSMAPVDWWVERGKRPTAFAEIKAREHASTKYPTVFLNLRKWFALITYQMTGPPSLYIVRFTDGIRLTYVHWINPRPVRIGGCSRHVKSASDVEPVIDVPIKDMMTIPEFVEYLKGVEGPNRQSDSA